MQQKTFLPSKAEVESGRKCHHLDASSKPLGRLASEAAIFLIGKHKRIYTPSMDCGDFVVISNAAKLKVTGNKADQKFYFRHSGYVDGKKIVTFKMQMAKDPKQIIFLAVRRMIDDNRLRDARMRRLKIFVGEKGPCVCSCAKKEKVAK
ncbi:MAG: 50S ribosomal protein L13 [Elusimicrobia bacterium]|nr:50S ribosomal protein L13 [Elusimicrobiota bacterium]